MMNGRPTKKTDVMHGPFRRLRKGLSAVVSSKVFLAVVSLLAAVLFWGMLVASDGSLTREKVFANVSVSVTGETSLKSRGFIVMDDLEEILPGVRMTVEVTQQNYDRVSGTSYNPHLDLSKVTGVGVNEIPVVFSSQLYGPVVECEPASVTVNVERYITRRVPVSLQVTGETPEGVYLDSVRTDPTMISVSGPQSVVSSVARAVVVLDRSALSPERLSDKTALDITLQTASGEAIVSDKLEVTNQTIITDSVVVETELLPMRDIPLDKSAMVTGSPAQGYELVGVETGVDAIPVAAQTEELDAMTAITTDAPLDISGAQETVSGYVRIHRVTQAENTLPAEVYVTAYIQETTVERSFRSVPVHIEGLDSETMKATPSRDTMTAQITGAYSFITGLEKDDVHLYVDVTGLEEGKHVLPVQIHVDNAQMVDCALSSPEITVTIRAK